jgi:microcompartment protein CcmL/EutN
MNARRLLFGLLACAAGEGEPRVLELPVRSSSDGPVPARLIVPVTASGERFGLFAVGEKLSEEPFSGEDEDLLLTVAEQLGLALGDISGKGSSTRPRPSPAGGPPPTTARCSWRGCCRVSSRMNDATYGPALGFLETSSIAAGIEATDAMMKKAAVDLLLTTIVPRGKYLILVGGAVADVEQSLAAGREKAGRAVVDEFLIQGVHPQLPAAIKGRVAVPKLDAVGIIETREVASAIFAGDAAAKAAAVTLIEARNQPGAKGLVVLTGDVGAVEAAVAAGVATVKKEGMLVGSVVIPAAHEALKKSLL